MAKYRIKQVMGAYHVIQVRILGLFWKDTMHSSFYKPNLEKLCERLNNDK
jgi:hypothetical protein